MQYAPLYEKVIEYILHSGKRLLSKVGEIQDIGGIKKCLTEEDLAIERGFKEIVEREGHVLFAEEENDTFREAHDVWIMDPISMTSSFVKRLGHYAIVASHLHRSEVIFAAVYDPTFDELFTAHKDNGSFLNNKRFSIPQSNDSPPNIIFNRTSLFWGKEFTDRFWQPLSNFGSVYRNTNSFALNYCYTACGRFDGIVALTRDTFPEHAGSLIIREANGVFSNIKGNETFSPNDKAFVGGNKKIHKALLDLVSPLFKVID